MKGVVSRFTANSYQTFREQGKLSRKQTVVLKGGPVAPASAGNLYERHIFGPHFRHRGWAAVLGVLTRGPGDSVPCFRIERLRQRKSGTTGIRRPGWYPNHHQRVV